MQIGKINITNVLIFDTALIVYAIFKTANKEDIVTVVYGYMLQ